MTLPASPPSSTWWIAVEDVGAGNLTISPNGLNLDGSASSLGITQNQGVLIYTDGTNYFTERGISGSGGGGSAGGVNAQTANYAAGSGDNGKLISMNGSSLTLTLPNPPPSSTWWIAVEDVNSTSLTISGNSLTIDGAASNLTLTQNQGVLIYTDGSNYFTERGMGTGSSSGTSVEVNGSGVFTTANFNDTTPAAPTGGTNVKWQGSGSSVSAYLPAPASGSISFSNANSPATINLSSVGTLDWLTLNGATPGTTPLRAQANLTVHSKQLGCWIKNSWDWFNGGTGTISTSIAGGSVGIAMTTSASDDMAPALSSVTPLLSLLRSGSGTPLNYGYRFSVPAFRASHVLKLDVGVNSVLVTITCSMSDGSVANQTTTLDAGSSGTYVQKEFTITYNAGSDNAQMTVTVEVTTNYGGSFQDVGFCCATLA